MRVLIVGCGRLGSDVAGRLVADGHTVFGLRRSERALPDGVVSLVGDVGRPDSLQLPEAVEACIYAVAAGGRSDDAYRTAYPLGVANVIQALERQTAADRLLFVSSTGVYGEDAGGVVDETSITEPAGFTGRRLLEAEEIVAASGFSSCSLRLSGIYGPNRRMLLDRVGRGEATYPGVGERWMNQIHQHDAARALVHVLGLDALPDALCISDTRPSRRREVLEWLAQELGAPAPSASAGNSSRGGEGAGKRVDSARLQASGSPPGFRFSFPTYVQGYGSFIG